MLIKRKERRGAPQHDFQAIAAGLASRRPRPPHVPAPLGPRGRRRSRRWARSSSARCARREAGRPAAAGAEVDHQEERLHALLGRLHGDGRGAERRLGRPGAVLGQPDQPRHALRQGRGDPRTRARRPPAEIPDEARQRRMAAHLAGTRRSTRSATSCSTIREKSGADSVYWLGSAKFTNEGAYLFRKFGAFWGTNSSTIRRASATRPRSRASPTPGATARRPTPTTTSATPRP